MNNGQETNISPRAKRQFYLVGLFLGGCLTFLGAKGLIDHKISITSKARFYTEYTGTHGSLISGFLLGLGVIILLCMVWQFIEDSNVSKTKK